MKRIALLMLAGWPLTVCAHPCLFDWNIEFSKDMEFHCKNLTDFAIQFNSAVRKETNGNIKKAIVIDLKPDTFTKFPEKSPFADQMETLIQRYTKVTAPLIKKGVHEYQTEPVFREFVANSPIACALMAMNSAASPGQTYEETKDGAIFSASSAESVGDLVL